MKRPSVGGFTAAGVLVVAILGGAVGGALVMSGQNVPAAPAGPVSLHPVADEATAAPVPAVEETPAPAPVVVVSTDRSGETATQAADRAATEADRASTAADRAEKTTAPKSTPAPAPVAVAPVANVEEDPAPKTAPAPAPECTDGQTRGVPAHPGEYQVTYGCEDGKWVETDRQLVPARTQPGTAGASSPTAAPVS